MQPRAILLAVIVALAACGRSPRPAREGTIGVPRLSVMTYNVNFGLGGDADGIAAIRYADPDLVVLQETTPAWERALRPAFAARYPHLAFHHCCGAGGLAILSRFPFAEHDYLAPVGAGWFPAWRVVVDSPLGPIQVLVVHLRPPLTAGGSVVVGYLTTPAVRRAEIAAFASHLDPTLPTLVVGDFNEPDDGGALRYLADRRLRSVLPELRPGADTWRWQTSLGSVHSQLDHIVYDPRLTPLDAKVVERGNSDHWPVVAVFERVAD